MLAAPSSLTPDEIRAAAATHHELGPEYQRAVIESFLDKVGREIDARVDARLGVSGRPAQAPARRSGDGSQFWLAICSMSLGIPLTGIVVAAGPGSGSLNGASRLLGLVIVWVAITVINVSYARSRNQRDANSTRGR